MARDGDRPRCRNGSNPSKEAGSAFFFGASLGDAFGRDGPGYPEAMRASLGIILAITALLLVGGCARSFDPDQAQICRVAAVALADSQDLEIRTQSALPPDAAGTTGVRITVDAAGMPSSLRWLDCRFTSAGHGAAPDLVEVRTDAGLLSEPRLFALKRFWLNTEDAAVADPLIAQQARRLPRVPLGIAYAVQQVLSAIPNAAVYGLLAAAYSLVYGLFGRINLAFGEVAAVGGFAALVGASFFGSMPPEAMPSVAILVTAALLGLWASGLHGIVIERLVLWPLRRSTGQQGLVATIGLALFLQEYLRLVQGSQAKWISSVLASPISLLRAETFTVTVTPIALILALTAFLASLAVLVVLRFSAFGRNWRATADDPGAAALFGVDPQALSMKTFALACGLAGLAGASVTVYFGSLGSVYTTTLGLKALIAAIIGGIGSVPGAFLGGLAIALVEAGWSAYFPIVYRDLVVDVLLVAMLVLRPGGLFGYRDLLPRRV